METAFASHKLIIRSLCIYLWNGISAIRGGGGGGGGNALTYFEDPVT